MLGANLILRMVKLTAGLLASAPVEHQYPAPVVTRKHLHGGTLSANLLVPMVVLAAGLLTYAPVGHQYAARVVMSRDSRAR